MIYKNKYQRVLLEASLVVMNLWSRVAFTKRRFPQDLYLESIRHEYFLADYPCAFRSTYRNQLHTTSDKIIYIFETWC